MGKRPMHSVPRLPSLASRFRSRWCSSLPTTSRHSSMCACVPCLAPFLTPDDAALFFKNHENSTHFPTRPTPTPSLCCLLHARNPAAELRFPRRLIGLSSPPADMRDESGSEESLLALPSMRLGLD